jgi:hypothetical protein
MSANVREEDYTLEKSKDDLLNEEMPYYNEKMKLSDDDKKRLKDDIFSEW